MRILHAPFLFSVLAFSTLVAPGLASAGNGGVILVSGAGSIRANDPDFYFDLDRGKRVFKGWDQTVLAAEGQTPENVPNLPATDYKGDPVYDRYGLPKFRHIDEPGAQIADFGTLKASFLKYANELPKGQPLVLYFTDHGGPDGTTLWGNKDLTVDSMRELLKEISPDRKVIAIHDHCYSGHMLDALFTDKGQIRPNYCGFSAAAPNEMSHTGESIMAAADTWMAKYGSFSGVIHHMRFDQQMASTTMATSDVFLGKYLDAHSGQKPAGSLNSLSSLCIFSSPLDSLLGPFDFISRSLLALQLQPELDQLKQDLNTAFTQSKLKPTSSYAQIEKALALHAAKIKHAEDVDSKLGDGQGAAVLAFVKSKVGKATWDKYSSQHDHLDELREKVENPENGAAKKAAQDEIDAMFPDFEKLSTRVQRYRKAAEDGRPEFKAFAHAHATAGGWRPDIVEAASAADDRVSNLMTEQRPLMRLSMAVKNANALELIMKNHDQDALRNYLSLLSCEQTPIPGGSS